MADYRKKQYPLHNYSYIIVCTPYRTGSTLLFNVLRFLFEKESYLSKKADFVFPGKNLDKNYIVHKAHTYPSNLNSTFVISSIRNPFDACISRYKFYRNKNVSKKHFFNMEIKDYVHDYINQLKELEKFSYYNKNLYVFKYEEFNNDLDFLLIELEKIFSISIDNKDKKTIKNLFSKENMNANSEKHCKFFTYDKQSLLFQNHVDTNFYVYEQETLKKFHSYLMNYKNYLEKWGYKIDY